MAIHTSWSIFLPPSRTLMENELLTVTQFVDLLNQTLSFAYPQVAIEGEVSSFKISQDKWVFFDLKDELATVNCFMPKYQLHTNIEDGMLIRVLAAPTLTKWGRFSLTVKEIELSGEGDVKKAFEKLKAQFEAEGLFALERKRALNEYPTNIALITSSAAAAYNDFITIIKDRWPYLSIDHLQVQVQGMGAPNSIKAAIEYCNDKSYDVVVVIRGGGSLEDLQAFNNELVVRAVYGSRTPTLVAIGHEDDISLAELAADVRGATPTDAARLLVPDKKAQLANIIQHEKRLAAAISVLVEKCNFVIKNLFKTSSELITQLKHRLDFNKNSLVSHLNNYLKSSKLSLKSSTNLLYSLSPQLVLKRGYSITSVKDKIITKSTQLKDGDKVMVKLWQGRVSFIAKSKEVKND